MLEDLCSELQTYLDPPQISEVRRAHQFSARAHEGQQRLSGEPYISHPLAVAGILAEMRMNTECIVAALLHDVIEDTPTAREQIAEQFGEDVAHLVDGVSKLTQIQFESRREAQAENFRKMLLAMVQDIRVIIIKLADRLHNMRTIGACAPDKRRRIAHETLEIYAPIANRLGMNVMRTELQELGFAVYYPMRYRVLAESVRKARGNRREIVTKIKVALEERLSHDGLPCRVVGREKSLYSIYLKMRTKRLSFAEVFDVYAFRIVVDSVDACYRALGAVHNLYKPVPGKFKDYIAIPKANGYQSLHTVLFGPFGVHIEVQMRSEDMEKVAEAGVAAHWLYKVGDSGSASGTEKRVREWMSGLLEMQKSAGNSLEFLENVKIDLFPDEVYVFTPRGRILALPRGATPVDFAYAVHTDLGNTCVAAKVDRRLSPLSSTLQSGQTVEVIASPGARPNPAWLSWVVTGKARANIRSFLKNLKREESVELGRRLFERALHNAVGHGPEEIAAKDMDLLLADFKCERAEQLYEDIGLGNRLAPLLVRRLVELTSASGRRGNRAIKHVFSRYMPSWLGGSKTGAAPLAIKGTEGMVVTFAKCCYPLPGDPIQGFVTSGRGIVVHAESCKNVKEFRNQPERWIDVQWEREIKGEFPVEIRVDALNRRGVLATIAAVIADMDVNINNVSIEEHDGKYSSIQFVIAVNNRVHLARVMRRIRTIEHVIKIVRKKA
ncbi:MAG: bifunctional GTP diphosphokinase/guanosine-3',5'-bis pyrophosphate 3'-pyrophosphohydrolase [Gammaproteobacteria bacterium]|nr:bifunctional GTP diphosphokinase/guanosine-3',5'-bis pyrophosphate 3'-pyrophosphohydrolase [Gammaproteobacteria bacterium]